MPRGWSKHESPLEGLNVKKHLLTANVFHPELQRGKRFSSELNLSLVPNPVSAELPPKGGIFGGEQGWLLPSPCPCRHRGCCVSVSRLCQLKPWAAPEQRGWGSLCRAGAGEFPLDQPPGVTLLFPFQFPEKPTASVGAGALRDLWSCQGFWAQVLGLPCRG